MDEYPLYPRLSEAGREEAQELINEFKEKLQKAGEEALGNLYCDIVPHIESDSWQNYRNDLMDGLQNYSNRRVQGEYDFKKIRQSIFQEFRDEILVDLNQDLVEENEQLKKELEYERKLRFEHRI